MVAAFGPAHLLNFLRRFFQGVSDVDNLRAGKSFHRRFDQRMGGDFRFQRFRLAFFLLA